MLPEGHICINRTHRWWGKTSSDLILLLESGICDDVGYIERLYKVFIDSIIQNGGVGWFFP